MFWLGVLAFVFAWQLHCWFGLVARYRRRVTKRLRNSTRVSAACRRWPQAWRARPAEALSLCASARSQSDICLQVWRTKSPGRNGAEEHPAAGMRYHAAALNAPQGAWPPHRLL